MKMFNVQVLDEFFRSEFPRRIADCYARLKIMTEADLQARTWFYLRRFLKRYDASRNGITLFNQLCFKELETFSDISIFKDERPWALIELKKRRHLNVTVWEHEKSKLLQAHEALNLKRCYLIWAARYGRSESVIGPGGSADGVFVGVPIILEELLGAARLKRLEASFRKWARYETEDRAKVCTLPEPTRRPVVSAG
jgi:hypothetical protein